MSFPEISLAYNRKFTNMGYFRHKLTVCSLFCSRSISSYPKWDHSYSNQWAHRHIYDHRIGSRDFLDNKTCYCRRAFFSPWERHFGMVRVLMYHKAPEGIFLIVTLIFKCLPFLLSIHALKCPKCRKLEMLSNLQLVLQLDNFDQRIKHQNHSIACRTLFYDCKSISNPL